MSLLPTNNLSLISGHTVDRDMAQIIPEFSRLRYGMPLELVASNNPNALFPSSDWPRPVSSKFTFPAHSPELSNCWYQTLKASVVDTLENLLRNTEGSCRLDVVRLGFEEGQCPLVFQLIVFIDEDDIEQFPDSLASNWVSALNDQTQKHWHGER
jgi:hypothetical protein